MTPQPLARAEPATLPLVAAEGLTVRRDGRTLLDGIDLALYPGEIVTVIGPNGAGKSTLVKALLGLVRPDAGAVTRRAGLRVGYCPQAIRLDPVLPLDVGRFLTLAGRADRTRLLALLDRVGLDDVLKVPVTALSGGELRRVLLARALLRAPELLVLDEPLAGVDVSGQAELYELIGLIRDETGAGVLLVSHDLHLVMARTDRVLCIEGHVCCHGGPVEVARDPAFLRLFGHRLGDSLALYRHNLAHHATHHPHHHAPSPDPARAVEPAAHEHG